MQRKRKKIRIKRSDDENGGVDFQVFMGIKATWHIQIIRKSDIV